MYTIEFCKGWVYVGASKAIPKGLQDVVFSEGGIALVSEVDSSLIFSAFLYFSFPPLPFSVFGLGLQQEGREEDQRLINLVGESLRLLGNTFVALSDLRCNLACAPPRHLHVVRPMSHYTTPMVLQQAAIPIQVGWGRPGVRKTGGGLLLG